MQRNEKDGSHLVRFSLSGGGQQPIPFQSELRFNPDALASNSVSPDGRILVTANAPGRWFNIAAILDPKTGKVQGVATPYAGDMMSPGWSGDGRILTPAMPMRSQLWCFRMQVKH